MFLNYNCVPELHTLYTPSRGHELFLSLDKETFYLYFDPHPQGVTVGALTVDVGFLEANLHQPPSEEYGHSLLWLQNN